MVEIWDEHLFALSAVVTVGFQLFCFFIAYVCNFDTITDLAGSSNFVLLVIMTLCLGEMYSTRQIILTTLVAISRVELAGFLLYRVLQRSKDARFDTIRGSFLGFLIFWVFQMFWAFLCCSPVIFVNTDRAGDRNDDEILATSYVGWLIFVLGFLCQVVADIQKYRFRADPSNKGTFCSIGIWAYSRHPNFFGEIVMWWGVFIDAVPVIVDSTNPGLGWWTIASPLFTMLILLFGTGVPQAEGKALARYYGTAEGADAWESYRAQTSPIIPLPRSCYGALPLIVKRIFFFEFAMYEYLPPGDGEEKSQRLRDQGERGPLVHSRPRSTSSSDSS